MRPRPKSRTGVNSRTRLSLGQDTPSTRSPLISKSHVQQNDLPPNNRGSNLEKGMVSFSALFPSRTTPSSPNISSFRERLPPRNSTTFTTSVLQIHRPTAGFTTARSDIRLSFPRCTAGET